MCSSDRTAGRCDEWIITRKYKKIKIKIRSVFLKFGKIREFCLKCSKFVKCEFSNSDRNCVESE